MSFPAFEIKIHRFGLKQIVIQIQLLYILITFRPIQLITTHLFTKRLSKFIHILHSHRLNLQVYKKESAHTDQESNQGSRHKLKKKRIGFKLWHMKLIQGDPSLYSLILVRRSWHQDNQIFYTHSNGTNPNWLAPSKVCFIETKLQPTTKGVTTNKEHLS